MANAEAVPNEDTSRGGSVDGAVVNVTLCKRFKEEE
jgi:hypothetical protein